MYRRRIGFGFLSLPVCLSVSLCGLHGLLGFFYDSWLGVFSFLSFAKLNIDGWDIGMGVFLFRFCGLNCGLWAKLWECGHEREREVHIYTLFILPLHGLKIEKS